VLPAKQILGVRLSLVLQIISHPFAGDLFAFVRKRRYNERMNNYLSRLTSSARGETFNPLIYPSFMTTAAYGIGFTVFAGTHAVGESSLFIAMTAVGSFIPFIWGSIAILTIIGGFTFLLFNIPPIGKASGLVGFMLWTFALFCWALSGGWLLVTSLAIPNMWFWIWQYFSLSGFRREDAEDKLTMKNYDSGGYDDETCPDQSKIDREDNRGMDRQSNGSYDNPDDGTDLSRSLDSH
jgi:hypothetical protein